MAPIPIEGQLSSNPAREKHGTVPGTGSAQDVPDFRVEIDFSTTYTTIAFIKGNSGKSKVLTIENFPDDRHAGRNGTLVQTEIWYLSERSTEPTTSKMGRERRGEAQVAPTVLYGYEIIAVSNPGIVSSRIPWLQPARRYPNYRLKADDGGSHLRKKQKLTDLEYRNMEHLDLSLGWVTDAERPQLNPLLNVLHKKQKIVVIAGASVSVSACIPVFRSSTGLFSSLR
ncbi:hypothetical protein EK21DRAFT_119155 [Setomelanomma holmii]|uniref:Uncharacterized protein n=1 Tax=Setomelanomma holmii TaxID=210430 RepID=A0A9P4LFA3_9PLEO|nr:hypothetical protein EK21DRAFT_119155 [Setomelanomma holmii]